MEEQKKSKTLRIDRIKDPGEIDYYSDLLTRHHYLGSSQIKSTTIVHVCRRGQEEVAILTWERGVRKWFSMRDTMIGWSKQQQAERLNLCIENRRFLMLSKDKNLASQVLSRSVERLNKDCVEVFGHECLLAETFVDPSLGYEGTCYKASGWDKRGLTKGGRGDRESSKKYYFVKELKNNALSKLKAVALTSTDIENPNRKDLVLESVDFSLLQKELAQIPDYRTQERYHSLTAILSLIIVAVLCGKRNAKDIHRWISGLSIVLIKSLGCRKHPSYSTIRRAITLVDHECLSKALTSWLSQQIDRVYIDRDIRIISFDGKKMHAASKTSNTDIHILSFIDTIAKVVVMQKEVGAKTNEIPVAQAMLEEIELDEKTIVTGDAMHTQKKTANQIVKKKPTTYLPLKEINQASKKKFSKAQMRIGHQNTLLKILNMDA